MTAPAICLHDLSFRYPGSNHDAVERVNLDVEEDEILSLVGPNGGGKTTILRLIMGDLQPSSGKVQIHQKPPSAMRGQLGYVPQHAVFDSRFPITVEEVILSARARVGWYSSRDRALAQEGAEKADVADLFPRPFADLSGGQRQRVLVARALARQPSILLLDEPTANIDPGNAGKLQDALRHLKGITCIIVSHDMEFVTTLTKRVACVYRTMEIHPTEEFSDHHAEVLFGAPVRRVRHDCHLSNPEHRHD